jgi:hypothetical protein
LETGDLLRRQARKPVALAERRHLEVFDFARDAREERTGVGIPRNDGWFAAIAARQKCRTGV